MAGWNVGVEDFLAAVLRPAAQPISVAHPDGRRAPRRAS
jgi:hypothetical protein